MTMSHCPYAVALSEDEGSHSDQQQQHPPSSPTDDEGRPMFQSDLLRKCPAFSSDKDGCPFKQAKSAEEVQQTLAQIPKSHYTEHQSSFYKVIQHMHNVHEQGGDVGFVDKLPSNLLKAGQCPMQPYIDKDAKNTTSNGHAKKSFAQAMEECSLAAIMARLAADMEEQHQDEQDDNAPPRPRHSEVPLTIMTAEESKDLENLHAANPNSNTDDADNKPPSSSHSLAEALKTGTAVSHQAAEDVHFVRNFIRGNIDRHLYQEMIMGLYHVYVALEQALDQHAPTVFPTCHFPDELRRVPSLQEDVEFWHNTRAPSARTISPATKDYMDRIEYLAHHQPLLLLAHSYTRYLGDLSGGRILARVARRALDLDKDSGDGLAFYRFDKVQSYKAFKDNYRHCLDALPLSQDQVQALVAEANVAFCLNMRLFQELDVMATIPNARVMTMEEVLEYAHRDTKIDESAEDQCPFLANKKKEQQSSSSSLSSATKGGARCPWPFIFAHDPWQGINDWQTWLLIALLVAWCCRYM